MGSLPVMGGGVVRGAAEEEVADGRGTARAGVLVCVQSHKTQA